LTALETKLKVLAQMDTRDSRDEEKVRSNSWQRC
jgi:hypothetical protein